MEFETPKLRGWEVGVLLVAVGAWLWFASRVGCL